MEKINLEVAEGLTVLEALASRMSDGHLTLMRFTTGWKVLLGTPTLTADPKSYQRVLDLPQFETLEDAINHRIFDVIVGQNDG